MITRDDFLVEWVKALRSGEFAQTTDVLGEHGTNRRCCLGVACEVYQRLGGELEVEQDTYTVREGWDVRHAISYDGEVQSLPEKVCRVLEVEHPSVAVLSHDHGFSYLTELNDFGKSFAEIADIIEENAFVGEGATDEG